MSLARELNLSTCTISKILNRSFEGFTYAPETIRKVEEAARERGYAPNAQARSLRTKRSMLVGLVVPSGIPHFSGSLVEGIERELRPHGYETLIGHSTGAAEQEVKLIRTLLEKGVDGLVWIPFGRSLSRDELGVDPDFPVILLDRPDRWNAFPNVITDNEAASLELAQRIHDEGHRSLYMLTAHDEDESILEREAGIRTVFRDGVREIVAPNTAPGAMKAISEWTRLLKGSVLVCLAQNLALGALQALRDANLDVGTDLGFASFDDLPLCELWQPTLTRVRQNAERLAAESARLALDSMRPGSTPERTVTRVPATLIWGTSVPPASDLS